MHAPVVCTTEDAAGRLAAELVANRLAARADLRLLLPTGRTPLGMYAALRAMAAAGRLPSAGATVLQLDEYAGLGPGDPLSFAAELRRQLAGVPLRALHVIDGGAADLAAEAGRHRARLAAAPLDLAVLGVGRNGHVAFDEPWSGVHPGVRLVRLAPETREDAAAAMRPRPVPERAVTTGLATLLACRELLVLVTGRAKAEILREVLMEPPSPERPASLLRAHPRLTVVCDRAAASALPGFGDDLPGHVAIVLGHREGGDRTRHLISHESLERLQRAERLVRRVPTRAVVLTGYTTTEGLSEAEQMAAAWRDPGVPFLLEVAGRNTAENASCSYPLVHALGGVTDVSVVSSAWHLRVPYFFRPYRDRGLQVRWRREFRGPGWPWRLLEELGKLPVASRERRTAWALEPAPAAHDALDPALLGREDEVGAGARPEVQGAA